MANLDPAVITLSSPDFARVLESRGLVRARIMARLGERLKRITQANGFFTNVGSAVSYGKAMSSMPPVPSVNFYDDNENGTRMLYNQTTHELTVTFECFEQWNQEGNVPDVMEVLAGQMLADIEVAVTHSHREPYSLDIELDELCTALHYSRSTILISLPPHYWVGAISEWILDYETVLGDPFHTSKEQTFLEEED